MKEDQLPVESFEDLNRELPSFPKPDYSLQMPSNAKGYVVIGNCLGSKEQLLISEIINKLPPLKKVFIIYEQPLQATPEFVAENFSRPIERIITLDELDHVKGGIINLNWTMPSRLKILLMLINAMSDECVLFFATGSHAEQVKERVLLVDHLCDKIVISLNKQKPNSLRAGWFLSHDPSMERANFACWEIVNTEEGYQYNLSVLSSDQMKQLNVA
ncbi:hypothetical protein [Aliiglaciecola sp. LCG003]|uniref:hypothetical protein n=1 Tax=Aliiglaciecola sp. LCG003 TaxID=3053655 RepID=UPI00257268E0|nr:hypothetical protein [Aliiglaciecola sp. LCG003]WJG07715.1 hypothetical protein QR722_10085 [Aliiglaciecola sp. LCG003]